MIIMIQLWLPYYYSLIHFIYSRFHFLSFTSPDHSTVFFALLFLPFSAWCYVQVKPQLDK